MHEAPVVEAFSDQLRLMVKVIFTAVGIFSHFYTALFACKSSFGAEFEAKLSCHNVAMLICIFCFKGSLFYLNICSVCVVRWIKTYS